MLTALPWLCVKCVAFVSSVFFTARHERLVTAMIQKCQAFRKTSSKPPRPAVLTWGGNMIQKDLLFYSVACSPVLDIWLGNVDLTPADCQEFNVSVMEFQRDCFVQISFDRILPWFSIVDVSSSLVLKPHCLARFEVQSNINSYKQVVSWKSAIECKHFTAIPVCLRLKLGISSLSLPSKILFIWSSLGRKKYLLLCYLWKWPVLMLPFDAPRGKTNDQGFCGL